MPPPRAFGAAFDDQDGDDSGVSGGKCGGAGGTCSANAPAAAAVVSDGLLSHVTSLITGAPAAGVPPLAAAAAKTNEVPS